MQIVRWLAGYRHDRVKDTSVEARATSFLVRCLLSGFHSRRIALRRRLTTGPAPTQCGDIGVETDIRDGLLRRDDLQTL